MKYVIQTSFDQIVYCMLCLTWLLHRILLNRGRTEKLRQHKHTHIALRNNSKVLLHVCVGTRTTEEKQNLNVSSDKWEFSVLQYFLFSNRSNGKKCAHTHARTCNHAVLRHWMSERLAIRQMFADTFFSTHFIFQKPITLFISIKSNSLSVVLCRRFVAVLLLFSMSVFRLVWTHFYCSICRTLCRRYRNERTQAEKRAQKCVCVRYSYF